MTSLDPRKKKRLFVFALIILAGLLGALVYKPQTYQEYLEQKHGKKVQETASGPQAAVENFLKLALSNKPNDAMSLLLEQPDESISSVDTIMNFLDIQIPLTFGYKIEDTASNNTTGKVTVHIITNSGVLKKDINLKNTDGQWMLQSVESKNNNNFLFTDTTNTLSMLIPQSMLLETATMEVGESYAIYDANKASQIMIFVTTQDLSEMLASLINCTVGKCANEEINGNSFETYNILEQESGGYAFTAKLEKNGIFYTIICIAPTTEDIESIKNIVRTVKI